jgi:hypothetical protein
MSDGIHASAYTGAEESLRQATALVKYVFRHLTAGDLQLTAAEADSMHVHLQELVLQAAAVGGCIREQQARHGRWPS